MGKNKRLQHIFRPDGKATIVAMDHGSDSGPVAGLENPAKTIEAVIAGGADAILTTLGIAKKFGTLIGSKGLIVRLDFPGTILASGGHDAKHDCELLGSVEEAVRIGADAVIITAGPGPGVERKTMANLAKVAEDCTKYGMPLVGEMYPGGFNPDPEMINIDNLALAARMGAEWGSDMLKMPYRPGYEKVVNGTYLPIVVLGGAKTNDQKEFFTSIYDAMQAGAKGVAIGRNIWGNPDPAAVVRTLNAIIHDNADVETAMKFLK